MHARPDSAFTIIELMLVVSILLIIAGMASPFFSNFVLRNSMDNMKDEVVGTIRKAQNYAMNRKNNATWGVCVNGSNVRLYSGSCASPTISEDYSIPSTVTVSNLNDTTFNLRGEPSAALTITISTYLGTKTVSVNAAGGVSYE